MTEAVTRHRLDGLEPDNLLAFLALLGLLRAIELSHPDWMPRAYWDFEKTPLRPMLSTQCGTTKEMICSAAIDGLKIFQRALFPFRYEPYKKEASKKNSSKKRDTKKCDKPRKALVISLVHQRSLARHCIQAIHACNSATEKHLIWQLRCSLIACSVSSITKKEQEVAVTPFKLVSGNMPFIGAMFNLSGKCKANDIRRSILSKWKYECEKDSLRFSPDEARRYAYRASDPQDESANTELGATSLSGLGVLSFPMVEGMKDWKMPAYSGTSSEGRISWPIWGCDGGAGASLSAIDAMLRSLPLKRENSSNLFGPGALIATARRYALDPSQPYYGNISRAEIEPLSE